MELNFSDFNCVDVHVTYTWRQLIAVIVGGIHYHSGPFSRKRPVSLMDWAIQLPEFLKSARVTYHETTDVYFLC